MPLKNNGITCFALPFHAVKLHRKYQLNVVSYGFDLSLIESCTGVVEVPQLQIEKINFRKPETFLDILMFICEAFWLSYPTFRTKSCHIGLLRSGTHFIRLKRVQVWAPSVQRLRQSAPV